MPPLYVIQQGAKLRVNNRRLQVEIAEEEQAEILTQIPIGQVSQLVLFGNIGLTTPAIDLLLAEGVDTVFLTQAGAYRGRLIGETTPHVPVRRAQYRTLDQPGFVLEMARSFVRAKLKHQRALLQRHNRENHNEVITAAIEQLGAAQETLARRTSLSSLRGAEGSAAAAYFSGYRRFFAEQWQFQARQRRPPPDPINALLSLGYTLLTQLSASAVQTAGLDPYAGYLHEVVYNRPALGLDVLEEFRPVVDGLVLWACRSGQVTPEDFTPGPPERPVVLGERGKRVFLQAFEQRLEQRFTHPVNGQKLTLRQCLLEQARQVAGCVLAGQVKFTEMGFR